MIRFRLNSRQVEIGPEQRDTPLVYVLRDEPLRDMTPKLGCGREQCGSCRVLVDGTPEYACTLASGAVEGRHVETAAGIGTPVRRALIEANATQCGYCLPGIVVAAEALFRRVPHPTRDELRATLAPQLCRCGSHPRVLRALAKLAEGE